MRGMTTLRTPRLCSWSSTCRSPYPRSTVTGARHMAGSSDHPLHCRNQLWLISRVARQQAVIEYDAVVVVDQLRLVPEFDRFAEPALVDRSSVAVMQAHHPARSVRGDSRDAPPGLRCDASGHVEQPSQLVHRSAQPTSSSTGGRITLACGRQIGRLRLRPAQRPIRVDQQPLDNVGSALGEAGKLAGNSPHRLQRLVAALRRARTQLRGDAMRAFARRPAAIPDCSTREGWPWLRRTRRRSGHVASRPGMERSTDVVTNRAPHHATCPRCPEY